MNTRDKGETVEAGGWRLNREQLAANAGIDPVELDEDARPPHLSDDDMPLNLAIDDDPDLRLRIGRYLGGVRRLKKVSQEQAAGDLRMSRPHLSNIEQGRSRTGWKGLREMATYYGYGMRALIEEARGAEVTPHPPTALGEAAEIDFSRAAAPSLSDDETFVLGLFRVLDAKDRQYIAKQMLQLVQARAGKVGAL